MKYRVENGLSLFEFHDSAFSLINFDGTDMVISSQHLNIHKFTEQNPSACDMEITSAKLTFHGFRSPTFAPGRAWTEDTDGKLHPTAPHAVFSGKEAEESILEELRGQINVLDFCQMDDGSYIIDGCGFEPFFTMGFRFDRITIEWDEYKEKAWYELHQQFQYDIPLSTPAGDTQAKVIVAVQSEDTAAGHTPSVTVCLRFSGKDWQGHGKDPLWIDAFADLQKQLPKDVSLKCCLTCRHGNLCPVGSDNNELFCTKDVAISQKNDLYFYTEDEIERKKRARQYCHVCDDYQLQSDDPCTYNDFLWYLKH